MEKASTQIIILAAGNGKRMKDLGLKVLVQVQGKSMIERVVDAAIESRVGGKPVVVINERCDKVKEILGDKCFYVVQKEQLGTGHAVQSAEELLKGKTENILVLNGDHPFVDAKTIKEMARVHEEEKAILTVGIAKVPDFLGWRRVLYDFGRIVRDSQGRIAGIIEKKDASESELEIKELNTGYFCFNSEWLWKNLADLKNNNAQSEYYLTDLVKFAIGEIEKVASVKIDEKEAMGVNTPDQLEAANNL